MKKLLLILLCLPMIGFGQLVIKTNFIERTDVKNKITGIFDLSMGSFINDDLIIGFTNEDAVADYIQEGFNPIQDRFIVSDFQLFFKYYYDKGTFFILKIPPSSDVVNISIFDRIRVGGGYVFHSVNNFDFDISYDFLLTPNINGFNKGRLTMGVSVQEAAKIPIMSFGSNLLYKFVNWINTPLSNGCRESMFLSKSN